METAKHGPVEALLGPTPAVERQPQKGEHRLVDALLVDRHPSRLARRAQTGRGPSRSVTRIPDAILDQLLAGADPKTAFEADGLPDELK